MSLFGGKQEENKQMESILPQDIYSSGLLELRDVISPAALEIASNSIKLGEKIARTFYVISYPRFLTENWFSPIINLDKIFDISVIVHPIDTTMVLRNLQKKLAEVQSQIHTNEAKGMVRDPMLDTAYQDIENLRDQLSQAREKIFDVALYMTLYANSEEELNKIEAEVKTIMESRLVYIKPALFQQEEGFNSVMPIASDKLGVTSKLNSSPLSSIFPFISFDLTSNKGILYGVNRHNSSLIIFDRFSLENYNSVIFAKAGAGKSYFVKLEILRSLMFDVDVIIIDPEKEYEFLAEAVGGRYFNISLTSEHHINPFDLPPVREDESASDVLRSHIISLVGLFRIMLGGMTQEEDAVMDNAIRETYALKDIVADSDFSQLTPPLLSDLELVLAGMEGGASLAQRLLKFTQGTWSGFLNRPTNVDINKKFVVFSVRDMEDELKAVAMHIVMNNIWGSVRRVLRKRLLIIDEAWWMMKSPDTASFLFGLAKRCRKYYLGLTTITQDIKDFMESPYGLPIITNSSMQILFKQSTASIDIVQKTFNLTDEEKFLLLESNVGEGIFFAGLKHVAIKVISSYTEDQIITSDPSQILAIKKAKEEFKASE